MIVAEYQEVIRKLYGAYGMLREHAEQQTWYEQLKDFDFQDVNASVNDYISVNNRRPAPADIVNGARRHKTSRRMESNYRGERLVHCPYCNDKGLIVTTSAKGIVTGTPCTYCGKGRENYPWDFHTKEEQDEILKEEERRGLHPPRHPYEAPKEFYMEYVYGL